ncbi:hypothetical protein QYF61_018858 [Mycteria americana]|uniref:Reverse transcriptase domain-containing protein n=1 Tax=Mycteria americana TaxID=33587 RepID=A0AAN7PUQ6_MYCAM|nr:hypothetical protein QYF61_018858 [Mycteria americana]
MAATQLEPKAERRWKRKVYGHRKQGQDYRDAVRHCREKIHVAKDRLEFKLASTVKDNKKGVLKYVNSNRRFRDNIGLLLDEVSHLTNRDVEKAEMFNTFFASVFNSDDGPWDVWSPVLEDHDWGGDDKLPANRELVRDLLLQLDVHKSTGCNGIHPRLPKELANVIMGPLSMIFQQSWESGEFPVHWKLVNVPIFKKGKKEDCGNYRPVSLTSVPRKIMEKVILGVEKHLRDNTVIGQSQHGFMRGKSCLTNLISFYDKVTHLVDQGKTVDVVVLDFSKAFDTVSHSVLLDKLSSTPLDETIIRWVNK